ncbi:UDP-galactopyranose mutase [Brevundimonas diminuta]|uniref:UDP-galactopyranose mutase n=1 Tax=Brevundimonas diminuta TaxID=293 RepID=UPI001F578C86|nr:UDP-galactopyranose mutase [Brevundimonas diminuta]
MSRRYDWLIVGAGFTGAVVAERLARGLDQSVLVIDRRDHVGGNAHDRRDAGGRLIHPYGPHVFHTNSARIFAYLSQFTAWRPYAHRVQGQVDGRRVPLPFNLDSIETLFPAAIAERMTQALVQRFGFGARPSIHDLRQAGDDPDLRRLGDYVFDKVFAGYTAKQWDLPVEALDASVTARVPIAVSRDDRYFIDRYQAMPRDGYGALFERMLDHPNITVSLNTPMDQVGAGSWDRMVYCGALDDYFGRSVGALPYRSVRFDHQVVDVEDGLPVGTVNYPNDFDFTRITDFRHLTGEHGPTTATVTEYPMVYEAGVNDPYYPILTEASRALAGEYRAMAATLAGKVWFAGRLADFQYYNMDQAVGRALSLVEKSLAPAIARIAA